MLKGSDYRLKKFSFSHKVCTACHLGIRGDVDHLVMQCPVFEGISAKKNGVLTVIEDHLSKKNILKEP